jgi:hypothetical protein
MKPTKTDQAYWDQKEAFIQELTELIEVFKQQLEEEKMSTGAISGHYRVATLFVKHINGFTDHLSFDEITVPNANKKFLLHVKWEGLTDWDPKEIKLKLIRFVQFLATKGHTNDKLLESL